MSDLLAGANWQVRQGDVLERLRELPDGCVQMVCCSPPYWGLRNYGVPPSVWGGSDDCEHNWRQRRYYTEKTASSVTSEAFSEAGEANAERLMAARWKADATCDKCGAWLGCLGAEPTPQQYVANMVSVFAEVWRVLRDDGCLFLNVGDTYAHGKCGEPQAGGKMRSSLQSIHRAPDIPEKSLCLIPERLAIALSDAGWIIRTRITWAKGLSFCPTWSGSVMPSSAGDRPTPASEPLWYLTKQQRYRSDWVAVREAAAQPDRRRTDAIGGASWQGREQHSIGGVVSGAATRNLRDVWCIGTEPSREEHYAAYPEALVEPCVLAGSSDRACSGCGAAWVRVVEKERFDRSGGRRYPTGISTHSNPTGKVPGSNTRGCPDPHQVTTGFAPGCTCGADVPTVGSLVLDPFCGSGTTGAVAVRLGRRFLGIELNPEYVAMSERRIGKAERARQPALFDALLESEVTP